MNVNKVILIGNITRDPELKVTPQGQHVCAFSMATNEVYVQNGQKQEKAEFHNVVAWGKTAENIAKYMRKGSQIYIEGKITTRSWESEGVKKYRTEIVALNVQFGSKPQGQSTKAGDDFETSEEAAPVATDEEEINVEDIPF